MLFDENILPDWNDVGVLGKNKLAGRAYFIHYPSCGAARGNRTPSRSEMVTDLCGRWKFRYLDSAQKLTDGDITGPIDGWREMPVPSVWQLRGVERPVYINVPFSFPATPPLVPFINPVGVYRRKFTVGEGSRRILTFLGVSSAFHVYINGKLAGYSEGSHNTAEFDVTDLVAAGENEIAVAVYKWCNGSYLECQDMFRYNGIFRDVFLTTLPQTSIFDIVSESFERDGGFDWRAEVTIYGKPRGYAVIALSDKDGEIASSGRIPVRKRLLFEKFLDGVKRWTAETPNVYRLSVTLYSKGRQCDFAEILIGFKTVTTDGGVFRVNGVPVKLKGVNHHDTHPIRGYALTASDYERDIRLMKSFNIDAVRFSHYPPHPYMLELCDIYGIYVVDEADIESHGELYMKEGPSAIANRPDFAPAFTDRVDRLFKRDRNHPCVVMWSLGNESGFGKSHLACYRMLKKYTSLPVHYEGAREWKGRLGLDVVSNMYPSISAMNDMLTKYNKGMPYFLCEYAHCMGVGPGSLKEYWELIESNRQCMGGCIWEFADHCYYERGDYRYGGDGGELVTDYDFCADGMFFASRSPKPSAYEVKNIYRPLVSAIREGNLVIRNRRSFKDSSDIRILLEWTDGKRTMEKRELELCIPPLSEGAPIPLGNVCARFLNITYTVGGHVVGEEQHVLKPFVPISFECGGRVSCREKGRYLLITSDCHFATFDLADGTLISWEKGDFQAINPSPKNGGLTPYGAPARGFMPNVFRRGISNDMYVKEVWENKLQLNKLWHNVRSVRWNIGRDCVAVVVTEDLASQKSDRLAEVETVYRVYADRIEITASARTDIEDMGYLPRFGLRAELAPSLTLAEYFGYGPLENETDFLVGARLGHYECDISKLYAPHVKPQEGGVRTGVERFALYTSDKNRGVEIFATDKPLSVAAYPFPAEAFDKFKHTKDVRPMGTTQVMIDGFRSGVGSHSCGHPPLDDYRFALGKNWQSFSFAIRIKH